MDAKYALPGLLQWTLALGIGHLCRTQISVLPVLDRVCCWLMKQGRLCSHCRAFAGMADYPNTPLNAQISALPLLDPLVPGRMESMPNRLAFVPQFGTSLSNNMVSPVLPCQRGCAPGGGLSVWQCTLCNACTFGSRAWPEALLTDHSVSGHPRSTVILRYSSSHTTLVRPHDPAY